jgi:hypothetical protein
MYLWFDAAGGTDKQFGVHFPMGMQNAAGMMMPRDRGGADPEELREKFAKESIDEAELIGANGTARITRSLANLPGVDIRTGNDRGAMVYEYRIPLTADVDSPYGIGAVLGTEIGVGVMTPEVDMSDMREQMRKKTGEGGRDGGPPGSGGRGGMGGGRGGMGGPPDMPDAIDVWAKLTLAEIESNDD